MASTPALAHEPSTAIAAQGLGFGAVLALTVVVGVLGGVVVLRWQRPARRRLSTPGVALLLVVLGCWAAVLAALEGLAPAAVGVAVGGVATWSLRNRIAGGHHVCDQAALGAVVTHRVVEGAIVATLYAASAALGTGAALVLAGHAAVETGAIAGLWSTSRWRWSVVAVVQAGFVVGAVGGTAVFSSLGSPTHGLILALLGGVLIAAGAAAESRRRTAVTA